MPLIKINLLTGDTRTIKAKDGTTMQEIIDIVVSRLRAINKQYFALQISDPTSKTWHWIPNNYSLPDANQRYPAEKDKPWLWKLKIRFLPNNIQNLANTDSVTFMYFYQQARLDFFEDLAEDVSVETAVQLGCLEMRRHFKDLSQEALNKKSNINMLENDIGFDKFIPKSVLSKNRSKDIKKYVQNYLKQFAVLNENQCVYKFFEILSKFKQIGSTTFLVRIGEIEENSSLGTINAEDSVSLPKVELHVGPLHGISYKQGESRIRIDFASITDITVEPTCTYETRVVLLYTPVGFQEERLDVIAPGVYTALELASLVDGYCIINTNDKQSRITPDSEGAPRSLRAKAIPSRTHSMYSTNRHSFNGPTTGDRNSVVQFDNHQRRSCFDLTPLEVPDNMQGPMFVEEEPDYAQAENDDFFLSPESVTALEPIGEGQFGTVYKGLLRSSESNEEIQVAIKTLKEDSSVVERDKFLAEAFVMKRFDHAHIITLLGVVAMDRKPPWIIMELADFGELRGYLHNNGSSLNVSTLLMFTEQVCSALLYLETVHKIVHRDVAARNVLVFTHSVVKLADFGLSRHVTEEEGYYKASRGRLPIKWMAPESINFRRFTSASDVWMFGVCIWELFMLGIKPFRGIKNSEVINLIETGERLCRPELMPASLYQLLYQCWSYEPNSRPSFSEINNELRTMIDNDLRGGESYSQPIFPPVKPPRPSFGMMSSPSSSSSRDRSDSFSNRSITGTPNYDNTQPLDLRQIEIQRQIEEQKKQSAADAIWLRNRNSHLQSNRMSLPIPSVTMTKKALPPLNIDRTTDKVYQALTALVQKIMDINQILEKVRADDFKNLVLQLGQSLKLLIAAAETETDTLCEQHLEVDRSHVDMAKQVLISDMKEVIASMQEAQSLSSTTVDQQYRQKLLIKCTVLAKDGKSLLEAVDYCRQLYEFYSPNPERSELGSETAFVTETPEFCSTQQDTRAQQQQQPLTSRLERCSLSVEVSRVRSNSLEKETLFRRQSAPGGTMTS